MRDLDFTKHFGSIWSFAPQIFVRSLARSSSKTKNQERSWIQFNLILISSRLRNTSTKTTCSTQATYFAIVFASNNVIVQISLRYMLRWQLKLQCNSSSANNTLLPLTARTLNWQFNWSSSWLYMMNWGSLVAQNCDYDSYFVCLFLHSVILCACMSPPS